MRMKESDDELFRILERDPDGSIARWKVRAANTDNWTTHESMSRIDMVNKPSHYQTSLGVEVIDIIDEFFRDNYNLGNVLKYLLRADKKGYRQQDLEKALVYLAREVKHGK